MLFLQTCKMAASDVDMIETLADEQHVPSLSGPCKICLQKAARYTCPRCNVRYCGLACYQSEKHVSCSESFYQDWVQQELPHVSASEADRQRMMEILTRCQGSAQDDLDSDDDSDDEPLEERLAGLDLDRDADEVWQRLTDAERSEFNSLLTSGHLSALVDVWTPWWTLKVPKVQETEDSSMVCGQPDHIPDIPDISALSRSKPSSDLRFSLVSVLLSYVFLARLHNGAHQDTPVESAQELLEVCGALAPGPAPTSSGEAIQAVLQALHASQQQYGVSPGQFAELIDDVCLLIGGGSDTANIPFLKSALSDVIHLFRSALQTSKSKKTHQSKKAGKRRVLEKTSGTVPAESLPASSRQAGSGTQDGDGVPSVPGASQTQTAAEDSTLLPQQRDSLGPERSGSREVETLGEKSEHRASGTELSPSGRDSATAVWNREGGDVDMPETKPLKDAEPDAMPPQKPSENCSVPACNQSLEVTGGGESSPGVGHSTPLREEAGVPSESSETSQVSTNGSSGKKVRFAATAPAAKAKTPGDSKKDGFRSRLQQAERKMVFLLSWAGRYGMAMSAVCPELHLEAALRKAEAEEVESSKSTFEKSWGGKTPKSKPSLIQEV